MAFDGIVLKAVADELKKNLIGLRVDRIYQVEKDEINILFRKYRLLISSSGNNPRIYLTEEKKESPKAAPLFSMVLRKHLVGAILEDVEQIGADRVLKLKFRGTNELQEIEEKSLIIEIMGRSSNIILVDKNNIIIDSITHVTEHMSRRREVLPHLEYEYLGDERKIDPLKSTEEEILDKLKEAETNKAISSAVVNSYTGFSKIIGLEVASRARIDSDRTLASLEENEFKNLYKSLLELIDEIKNDKFKNKIYYDVEKIAEFHVVDLESLRGLEYDEFESPSKMLESVYFKRDKDDRLGQKSQALKKNISNRLSKDRSKLINLEKDLYEAEDREKYRIYGDILSANLFKVGPGDKEITLENFYTEDLEEITIPLDKKLSPQQNAQKFYKKYTKLKNAQEILKSQIDETKTNIAYLESIESQIELADEISDIEDIKSELIEEGFLKRNNKVKSKKKNESEVEKREYKNFTIYFGKNNRQNDLLTHKMANREDIWLHIKDMPGSHVIINNNGENVPEEIIEYAAEIAAYNSKARNTGSVDVDYTIKKNVKRHPSNKPGLVNYTEFNTILVKSDKNH